MKRFFVKICKSNTYVYYELSGETIKVYFEQPIRNRINKLILDCKGIILEQDGFNNSEVANYQLFLKRNIGHIQELIEQNI